MVEDKEIDVVVVGAGPAGLGVSVLLKELGLNFVILERDSIGASFKKWPKETKFISPSFTGNFFKMPDLNAITPDTSPALSLSTEHPTGEDYVEYLEGLSAHFRLPVYTGIDVKHIEKEKKTFIVNTNLGQYRSKFLIWAAGEFQYPKLNSFKGSDLCTHYSEIDSFADLDGDERIVIGAFESGFDAAVNLVNSGNKVRVIDDSNYLERIESDSSYCLSPFTRDRIHEVIDNIDYHAQTKVANVELEDGKYIITTKEGEKFSSNHPPINCTGFASSLTLVNTLFLFNKQGYPLLSESDESTITKNLFLVGPQVKHNNALFCFIYKYRQRFAIVAEHIAKKNRVRRKKIRTVLKDYKELNFYMDDLSCCDGECVC